MINSYTFFKKWIAILLGIVASILSGCATFTPVSPYCVALRTEQAESLWVHGIKFGEQTLSYGGMGRGGSKSVCPEATSTFPDKAMIRWQKEAHYTEYPNLPMYEREVVITKPLLPLERKHFKYEFLFTIKEDNNVTLEVSRVIDPSPEMWR